ncbi:putative RNA-directed DNA polymerase [Helianthus debilis subsp. tardiflorus]
MNVLSINIRGLGVEKKAGWIKEIKHKEKASFIAFQETNRSDIPDRDIEKFWGGSPWAKEVVNPTGRSGGLLCIWDTGMFTLNSVIKDSNFLVVIGSLKGCSEVVAIVNVYAPQRAIDKRALWVRLQNVKEGGGPGLWLFTGDFNAVRGPEERKNSRFKAACANDFNRFIHDNDLCDLDLKGGKFTYMAEGERGLKFSKIDRMMVCKNFQNTWPEAFVRVLPRRYSDHNPLLMVVTAAMEEFSFEGPADLNLIHKLRFLRNKIKAWRDESRGKEDEIEERARQEFESLEVEAEFRDLTEDEEWVRLECKKKILEAECNKAKDLKQRARVKWAMDGDDNTKFFHGLINKRKSTNSIPGLFDNNGWVSNPKRVKRMAFNFFRDKFWEEFPVRPDLICSFENKVSEEDAVLLTGKFSRVEIKQAIIDCGSEKAPGPDGFNMKFIKRFWNHFEEDFVQIFENFYDTGGFSIGCSSSFISLIPKVKDPQGLNDYRPINLVGIYNKAISKVLANRLKSVIGKVISINQSAFIKDRLILDGPLILNEVIAWAKKKRNQIFLFKIDFAKAYDIVNWNFVSSIMNQMGFPPKWCLWIHGILSSARSSVLINGSPTFEFPCHKGMRQGDPISPFIFLIVMEALSSMIRKASRVGALRGIVLPNDGPVLTHLLYADDCVIMGEWARNNIKNVALLLRCFHICSGLKINLKKSSLFGVGVEDLVVEEMASMVNCSVGRIPFIHLGVPVGAKMCRVASWKSIFDIFEARLALWKVPLVSLGGRVTIVKSVLESLPNYFLSLFKAPVSVTKGLESIIKKFLWGGGSSESKMYWVAWNRVTTPVSKGGIGLSRLKDTNIALLSKWIWRFRNEGSALWKEVISSIHGGTRSWSSVPINKYSGGVWKGIVSEIEKTKIGGVPLINNIKGLVGNGLSIRFWLDPWVCNQPLKDRFPALFRLETQKKCLVADRFDESIQAFLGRWVWSRTPVSQVELDEWNGLIQFLDQVVLSDSSDRWEWVGGDNKDFSVGAVKSFLRSSEDFSNYFVFEWSKWTPKKVNIFMWRAQMGRIATLDALSKRNCFNGEETCVMCNDGSETVEHLFCSCAVAAEVWFRLSRWCRIDPIYAFSLNDLLEVHKFAGLANKAKEILKGVIMVGCWCIWRARNERRFSNIQRSVANIVMDVKSLGYLWYSNRSKKRDISWDSWISFSGM